MADELTIPESNLPNITRDNPFSICFVCLGNICRSPTAEGVFQHLVEERGLIDYFEIDSAGTSAYHIGEPANSKSQAVANEEGITLHSRARKFKPADLDHFDMIVAMDRQNYEDIKALDPKGQFSEKIYMLREFDPEADTDHEDVPDPYYGGMNGFQNVFNIVYRSSAHLLDQLANHVNRES